MEEGAAVSAMGIIRKTREEADETLPFVHGRMHVYEMGEAQAWRSELEPGWSFDEDLEPYAEGAKSCPYTHREYIESGRIRYLMDDGTELEAGAGDLLFIPPGHRAWVVGDETCVLIDW
jgi:mannose-6-phosphate isomerase-like protein (cupin superfamily)